MISPAKCELDIDPTGRLPIHTEWGGDYHVVFYHYDANYIHVEFAQDRNKKTLAAALQKGLDFLNNHDMDSSYAILDKELSAPGYKKFFKSKGLHLQLVPPHSYRRNMAERTSCTWKNH
jgi:hypothetical protein